MLRKRRFHCGSLASRTVFAILISISWSARAELAETGSRDDLGLITGASLDRNSGQLILLGDGKHPELITSDSVIATAFQWIYPDSPRFPYVSIDPIPDDPEGPYMLIDFDPVTRGTEFGWIMFEADRLLKCLALGKDNVFGLPETSTVPGYRNMFDLNESLDPDQSRGGAVWSRFWFHSTSNQVQWDDSSVRILDCRIGVKTEVMTMRDGTLVSTGGEQDPGAKAFADHFTENYREFGREFPVFLQLEQLGRIMLVAEWLRQIREKSQPVSIAWVRSVGGNSFSMPSFTPSLRAGKESSVSVGGAVRRYRQEIFGGVDLSIAARRSSPDPNFNQCNRRLAEQVAKTPHDVTSFAYENGNGRKLPQFDGNRLEHPVEALITAGIGADAFVIGTRPNTLSKHPIGGTSARELALPYLPSYNPLGFEGRSNQFGVQGRPESLKEVRTYELSGPEGTRLGLFDHHRLDPLTGDIFIEGSKKPDASWKLSPDRSNPDVIWAVEGQKRRWAFDRASGEILAEFRNDRLYRYRYNQRGRIEALEAETVGGAGSEAVLKLERDYDQGPVTSLLSSDRQRITLRSEARLARGQQAIEFDARNEVGEVKRMRFNPERNRLELSDGAEPSSAGFSSIEVHMDKILLHRSGAGRDFAGFGRDGYTLFLSEQGATVIPLHLSEVERQVAKAVSLPVEELHRSQLSKLFPQVETGQTVFVSGDSAVFRHYGTLVAARMREGQVFVATADRPRAEVSLAMIRSRDMAEGGTHRVVILHDSLRDREGALSSLADVISTHGKSDATGNSPPVLAILGHNTEGTIPKAQEICRGKRDAVVICLICNMSGGAKQSQELAESFAKAGAGSVLMPRGPLDARDANRIVTEMDRTPPRTGEDALQWIQGILKHLKLEDKFGPPTSKFEGRRGWESPSEETLPG